MTPAPASGGLIRDELSRISMTVPSLRRHRVSTSPRPNSSSWKADSSTTAACALSSV